MPRRRTQKRRKRRTQKRRKKRRKTRRRKGGKIIDHWKIRPGMVVKPLVAEPYGGFHANEVWKITSMQNHKISFDVLSPVASPAWAQGEIPMVIIPVMGIRFDLVEKASPQSLVTAIPKFAAMKSKKRNPSSIQQLALNKISTLDRKKIKDHMPGLLKPKKIKYKT